MNDERRKRVSGIIRAMYKVEKATADVYAEEFTAYEHLPRSFRTSADTVRIKENCDTMAAIVAQMGDIIAALESLMEI